MAAIRPTGRTIQPIDEVAAHLDLLDGNGLITVYNTL